MIRQFVPGEYCLKCKGCCRFSEVDSVWLPCLLDEEILELMDKKIPPAYINLSRRIKPVADPQGEGFLCAFLGVKDSKCQINQHRPFECQLYPFLIALRKKKVLLTVDLNCPYVKEKMGSPEFKEYIDFLVSYLNSPKQLEILKNNPQIIQAYQEVLDIVELKFQK